MERLILCGLSIVCSQLSLLMLRFLIFAKYLGKLPPPVLIVLFISLSISNEIIHLPKPISWFFVAIPYYWAGKFLKNKSGLLFMSCSCCRLLAVILGLLIPLIVVVFFYYPIRFTMCYAPYILGNRR